MADEINETPSSPEPASGGNNIFDKNAVIGAVVIVVLLVGALLVFGGEDEAQPEPVSDEAATEDTLEQIVADESEPEEDTVVEEAPAEVKEFTLTGTNFASAPNELRVKPGDTVRVTLVNDSTMPHDWRLDEFNAATDLVQPGQEGSIEFVASETGEFEYYCSVGQHRQLGMVGKLIVE